MRFRILAACLVAVGIAVGPSSVIGAMVIYHDDFDGSAATNLNGTAPDVRPGAETWAAHSLWKADGSKSSSGNVNAWLPFTPEAGKLYALSIDANPDISGSSDWFALGFSDGSHLTNWHTDGGTQVFAWLLDRENDASTSVIQTFSGPDTTGSAGHDLVPDVVGPVSLMVQLDTKPANWTVEWFAGGNSIRGPLAYGTNPTINYAGFGAWSSATGVVDNFTLLQVPEPSTGVLALLAMLGPAGAAIAVRRRKRRRTGPSGR